MDIAAIKPAQVSIARVRWQWLIPVGLFLLAVALYAQTSQFEIFWSWDDNRYLRENEYIRDFSAQGIVNLFTHTYFAAYIPITLLSYMIEYHFWGLESGGYHVTNLLLHALNGALVYLFVYQLVKKRTAAVIAAVLFVVHPLQVESVAWVSERKNLLAMLFTMLAFLAHMRSAKDDQPPWALGLAWFFYLLAALSKPSVVGVPFLFMAYDYFWAKRSVASVVARNLVPLLIGVGSAAAIYFAHEDYGGIKTYRGGSFFSSQLLMLVVYWDYLVSFILPLQTPLTPYNLNNFYLYPTQYVSMYPMSAFLGALLLVGMALIALYSARKHLLYGYRLLTGKKTADDASLPPPFGFFAILWIVLFMLPVANIVPIAIERTDRYMYYPSVVIFAAVGLAVEGLWNWLSAPKLPDSVARYVSPQASQRLERIKPKSGRIALAVIVIGVIGFFTVITLQRIPVWRTEGTLWIDHLRHSGIYDRSGTGWLNLGVYYYNNRDFDRAIATFERLLSFDPNSFKGNRFMGHIAIYEERWQDAVGWYQRALRAEPDDFSANRYLGMAYYELGDYENAVASLRKAIQIDRNASQQAHAELGTSALRMRDYELARQALEVAVQRDPEDTQSASDLCAALAQMGNAAEAVQYCQRAAEQEPNNGLYQGRLAHMLIETEQYEAALTVAQHAVEIAPGMTLSYRVLGDAYEGLGDIQQAVAAYRRALELDPNNRRAREGINELLGNP